MFSFFNKSGFWFRKKFFKKLPSGAGWLRRRGWPRLDKERPGLRKRGRPRPASFTGSARTRLRGAVVVSSWIRRGREDIVGKGTAWR